MIDQGITILKQMIKLKSFLIVFLFLSTIFSIGVVSNPEEYYLESLTPNIIHEELPIFGGINSIRADIGSSSTGVLFSTNNTPNSLYLFTQFSQKLAKIQFLNQRGAFIINETELIAQNTFLLALDSIVEFEDTNNDGKLNFNEFNRTKRVIDLSKVQFNLNIIENDQDLSGIYYKFSLSALNIPYHHFRGMNNSMILENLTFSFEFRIISEEIQLEEIPIITIRPTERTLEISKSVQQENLSAIKHISRLKFSFNVSGWDYSSTRSKLMLNVENLYHERIALSQNDLELLSQDKITREIFKSTNLLGKLKFSSESLGRRNAFVIDHGDHQTTDYFDHLIKESQLSIGNNLRSFMNFTWVPVVSRDGFENPINVQPFNSGERIQSINPFRVSFELPTIYLNLGFILPQGKELLYDPEIEVEEINPLIKIIPRPNRLLIQNSSFFIMISGFFLGIVIIIRQKYK